MNFKLLTITSFMVLCFIMTVSLFLQLLGKSRDLSSAFAVSLAFFILLLSIWMTETVGA